MGEIILESHDSDEQPAQKLCICCHREFPASLTVCPDDGTALVKLNEDSLVGTVFVDKYEILNVIGGGGMGKVYRAKHRYMKRVVAIKVLHNAQMSSGNAIKRFQIEAQAASTLSQQNITTIFDFGTGPGAQPFMVMDYLDGPSLDALVENEGKINADRALHIFIQITRALAHAHGKGIVHRDIKPSNIVLINFEGDRDFVKLVDFGIAKLLNPSDIEGENLTRTGEVFGSVQYMSPEQCRGQKLDTRTDMYSLGAVIYFALAGRPMFDDLEALRIAYKHVTELPASFQSIGVEVAPALEAIIFKTLAKEPDNRYQSMSDLLSALEQYESTLKGSAGRLAETAPVAATGLQDQNLSVSVQTPPVTDMTLSAAHQLPDSNQAKIEAGAHDAAPLPTADTTRFSQGNSQSLTVPDPVPLSLSTAAPPSMDDGAAKVADGLAQTVHIVLPKRLLIGVAAALGLLVIGGAIFFFGQGQKSDKTPVQNDALLHTETGQGEQTSQPDATTAGGAVVLTGLQDEDLTSKKKRGRSKQSRNYDRYSSPYAVTGPASGADGGANGGNQTAAPAPQNNPPQANNDQPAPAPQPKLSRGNTSASGGNGASPAHGFGKFKNAVKRFFRKLD